MLIVILAGFGIMQYVITVVEIIAFFLLLKKCGVNGWWGLVPGIRDYKLAKVSDRKSDGIMYMVFEIITYVTGYIFQFLFSVDDGALEISDEQTISFLLFFGVIAFAYMGGIIYSFRIFSGLCNVFNVKKRWLWLIVGVGRICPMLIWGLGKKYVPTLVVDESENEGAAISGIKVDAVDKGLTINIEERTAMDSFKKKYLLRDIHMNIEPGHMVLLLGGSGAGKTTFVNAVNGYEKAKADIILNGSSIYDDYGKMKYRIGFVPQMDLMRGNDSVYSTLRDAGKLRLPTSMSGEDRRKRIEETLDFFGLMPVKDKLCDKLSGGQRKRLSIAMEYISNPDLFILDEPDSGLDGVMARELMEGLRKIADQGKIVIVITHSPDRVIDLFDDVIVLAKDSKLTGRLTFFGPIEKAREFFEREEMEKIVLRINRVEEGGEGLADSFIEKYAEVCHG